jgi:LytS/YehU family sensor histidine kinase
MNSRNERLLHILGSIMIICGFLAYYYAGTKALSLFISSIGGGAIAWIIAYLQKINKIAGWYGLGFIFASSIIFGQRSLANLMVLIGIIQNHITANAYHKGIHVVLLSIICVSSICSMILYYVNLDESKKITNENKN